MTGILYIVGTPIGNLEDITMRALRILREVDLIAAEDTRVSGKLLRHFEITTRVISYHRHSGEGREQQVLDELRSGSNVALISDAGMPGISDPGQQLIAACNTEKITVVPIPGPSSVTTALAVSGFQTDNFRFLGFLPRARKARMQLLRDSLTAETTCAAFESPHRVTETLADFAALAPKHPVLLARELTKKFEELRRGSAEDVAAGLHNATVKGEIVLVWPGHGLEISSPVDKIAEAVSKAKKLRSEGMSARDAADRAAAETGAARKMIYRALISEK